MFLKLSASIGDFSGGHIVLVVKCVLKRRRHQIGVTFFYLFETFARGPRYFMFQHPSLTPLLTVNLPLPKLA